MIIYVYLLNVGTYLYFTLGTITNIPVINFKVKLKTICIFLLNLYLLKLVKS